MVVFKALSWRDLSGHLLEYQGRGLGGCPTQSVAVVGAIRMVIVQGVLPCSIT